MPRQSAATRWAVVSGLLVLAGTALPSARAQDIDGPTHDQFRRAREARDAGGRPDLDVLEKAAKDGARDLEAAKEAAKELAGRHHGDPLADAAAKRAKERGGRPGDGWPVPIGPFINGVVWLFTEAPWWVVVLVALPLVASGIGLGLRRRGRRPRNFPGRLTYQPRRNEV